MELEKKGLSWRRERRVREEKVALEKRGWSCTHYMENFCGSDLTVDSHVISIQYETTANCC